MDPDNSTLSPLSPLSPLSSLSAMDEWFHRQGWEPWPFQREAWAAFATGHSGLIHVPTGAGKTYAAFGGPFNELLSLMLKSADHNPVSSSAGDAFAAAAVPAAVVAPARPTRGRQAKNAAASPPRGLRVIYVTPLRALARDIELALKAPLAAYAPHLRVESRTGDSEAKVRARQARQLPEVLITTPESLALMIARADAATALASVIAVLVDEWHELLISKRGVQLQLTLSRLRHLSPQLRTWGMSATLHDPESAAQALLPFNERPVLVCAKLARPVSLTTLLPNAVAAFPWAGHLGLKMLPQLLAVLDPSVTNLIFTNTRSQAERWLQAIRAARPDWSDVLALHHGSLDRGSRAEVEEGLKSGRIRIVVATSSLDLGVDFPSVEQVYQIGSPKGVARLLQRAGRGAHRPLASCQACLIPTNSLELIEFAAARRAIAAGHMEERPARRGGLDVLTQHLVSCALGGGFGRSSILEQVRSTAAYADLTDETLAWCLLFITTGGAVLDAYPAYHRVVIDNGDYQLRDRRQAQLHRMNIGTIVADEQVELKLLRGQRLGRVDEHYVTRLRGGDRFIFAGKTLEFVKMHELTAFCRAASGKTTNVPAWQGSFLPLSLSLGDEMRHLLGQVAQGQSLKDPEMVAAAPLFNAQLTASLLPTSQEILLETWRGPDGCYLFLHAFAGRQVHEALASLLALRLSRLVKTTFAVVASDYGLGLISTAMIDYRALLTKDILTSDALTADLAITVDAAQTAKRRFREIARIAGLVRQQYPGQKKGGRAVHVSTSLLYDTLARFDPDNLLVAQARSEATEELSGQGSLLKTLVNLRNSHWLWSDLTSPSPLAFALVVERVRARLGSESVAERVKHMLEEWGGQDPEPDAQEPPGELGHARRQSDPRRRRSAVTTRARRVLGAKTDAHRRGPPLG